jgi:hypothetical protein
MLSRTVASLSRLMHGQANEVVYTPSTERRLTVRHVCNVETTLQPAKDVNSIALSAQVSNISRTGIQLIVDRSFQPGEFVSIELAVGGEQPNCNVLAFVVHVKARADGRWGVGCAFASELSDADLESFGARGERSTASDGRLWVRQPCRIRAAFQRVCKPGPEPETAQVLDISPIGCGLSVERKLEVGTLLSLHLTSAQGQSPLTILSSVVRVALQPDGRVLLGCTFVRELSDTELDALLAQEAAVLSGSA